MRCPAPPRLRRFPIPHPAPAPEQASGAGKQPAQGALLPGSRFLCSGTGWDASGPFLGLYAPDGTPARLSLTAGTELRYRIPVEAGEEPARFCLGSWQLRDGAPAPRRFHSPCPAQAPAERGYQCGSCFARDELRAMHNSHRADAIPATLRRYLDQPHWLYTATFADGTTKVGTAADPRKRLRLIEQGAVRALLRCPRG